MKSIQELVRKNESEYLNGTVHVSKYVNRSMYDDINQIEAYLNSQFISGKKDSQGRDKPFFNIVVAAANIWMRATAIQRSNIKIYTKKAKRVLDTFLLNVVFRNWARKAKFGRYLSNWGRTLARYGSAVTEIVEKEGELHINVIPWNRLIVDPINFYQNPVIKILELTEAELRSNHLYNQEQVEALLSASRTRENLDKQQKDNKTGYYKLYEVHGKLPLSFLTGEESDEKEYVQQMHVVSFVGKKGKDEHQDFTLYSGREEKNPYYLSHLIEEDGFTLSIGAVQHLFEAQWMENHSMKQIKDQLDLASKMFFQTADPNFVGKNVLGMIENGQIMVHSPNMPITQVNNQSHDIAAWQSVSTQWKNQAHEVAGISEAMAGQAPKSGTAWRQTEAILRENYSLFEEMRKNKGLYLEDMIRERIIPFLKDSMNTSEQIEDTLDSYDLEKIDMKYIKNKAIKLSNDLILKKVLSGEMVSQEDQIKIQGDIVSKLEEQLQEQGSQRFFKPSEADNKTWKEQFKGLEYDVVVDITGEEENTQMALTTLTTVLQTVGSNPRILEDPTLSKILNSILEKTGTMSGIELSETTAQAGQLPMGEPRAERSSVVNDANMV